MAENLVIVESPGKIKKISEFLGKNYKVVASYGHIRDLAKGSKGVDKKNNFEPTYVVSSDKKDVVSKLKELAKKSKRVYLAQDQDREGESISYHLIETLKIPESKYQRIVFQEITKKAIQDAIKSPRKVDMDLVNAQQARRVLDRLVGFDLSPLLWQKIQKGLSAGRVQSVALKLIAEREKEINSFEISSKFKVVAIFDFKDNNGNIIPIRAALDKRFDNKNKAEDFLKKCIDKEFSVSKIEKKPHKKSPSPPFTTSTLQQAASRNLRFSVDKTMRIAQKLYESGHITYMRTDSTILSEEIIAQSSTEIKNLYGKNYSFPRRFKTKNKSAQEAHEAIRPTHIENRTIYGTTDENKLYELIWKKTIASQMADAQYEKTSVHINTKGVKETFVASGEVLKFDGFLKAYSEKSEKNEDEDENQSLPNLKTNDVLTQNEILSTEVFKKPQPRFAEASLVKKLEELGIGRPSTYASIISTIQKRNYVETKNVDPKSRDIVTILLKDGKINKTIKKENYGAEKNKLLPTDVGMIVNDFLARNFKDVINYNFTATVENEFDEIAKGKKVWNKMISEFYAPFYEKVKCTSKSDAYSTEIEIGIDPATNKKVTARIGRYGPMVQLGEKTDTEKPKYAKLKKNQSIKSITLEEALELLKWPREVGEYKGEMIISAIGRYGPYIKYKDKFYSLKDNSPAETISLKEAIDVIKTQGTKKNKNVIKEFKSENIKVLNGKFGPYISKNKKNYKITNLYDAATITLKECKEIIKNKK